VRLPFLAGNRVERLYFKRNPKNFRISCCGIYVKGSFHKKRELSIASRHDYAEEENTMFFSEHYMCAVMPENRTN